MMTDDEQRAWIEQQPDRRITQDEMIELFGLSMPIEAVMILMTADGRTIDEVRFELQQIAWRGKDR